MGRHLPFSFLPFPMGQMEREMFARTKRLFLRPAWPEDAEALVAAIADEAIIRNLATAPWPYGIGDAREKIARDAETPAHEANCLVFLRTAGAPELVGSVGFGRWNEKIAIPEIGYWVARKHWGKGIAVEAAEAVLEAAFLGVGSDMLGAGHFIDNPASGKVLRKLGFVPTGEIIPYPCRARGCEIDSVEYRLSRERWLDRVGMYREAA